MEKQEILEGLKEALGEVLGKSTLELTMATRQDDVEGWDSLAHIQLVLALGKRFGVKFTTKGSWTGPTSGQSSVVSRGSWHERD